MEKKEKLKELESFYNERPTSYSGRQYQGIKEKIHEEQLKKAENRRKYRQLFPENKLKKVIIFFGFIICIIWLKKS